MSALLYDPEAWSFTPRAEQPDPASAAQRARDIAHAHGLSLIVAPALNLTTLRPDPVSGPGGSSFSGWGWPARSRR